MNIFDILYPRIKLGRTISVFEAFSGYGSQSMALKELGINIKHIGMSDWWIVANKTYHAIHGDKNILVEKINDKEKLINILMKYGLSSDDKTPIKIGWYKKKSIDYLQELFKILKQNKNYGAIGTFERLPENIDLCTWSFPCQDISLAGNQKGMVDGSKSNYGYIFLDTLKATPQDKRPKVLLMENVRALFSQTFKNDWREIQLKLENMGYSNYAEVLNAKEYGVAQNRDRVFIVSILGQFNYKFPKPYKLKKKIKDYLEDNVDEKYYLGETIIKAFMGKGSDKYPRKERFIQNITRDNDVANAITTRSGDRPTDCDDIGIVLKDGMILDLKSSDKFRRKPSINIVPTIMTDTRLSVVEEIKPIDISFNLDDQIIVIDKKTYIIGNDGISLFRIRKLTPREALRLMNVSEKNIDIILSEVSDSQAYKLAGNSIVVNVLVEIFRNLF